MWFGSAYPGLSQEALGRLGVVLEDFVDVCQCCHELMVPLKEGGSLEFDLMGNVVEVPRGRQELSSFGRVNVSAQSSGFCDQLVGFCREGFPVFGLSREESGNQPDGQGDQETGRIRVHGSRIVRAK